MKRFLHVVLICTAVAGLSMFALATVGTATAVAAKQENAVAFVYKGSTGTIRMYERACKDAAILHFVNPGYRHFWHAGVASGVGAHPDSVKLCWGEVQGGFIVFVTERGPYPVPFNRAESGFRQVGPDVPHARLQVSEPARGSAI